MKRIISTRWALTLFALVCGSLFVGCGATHLPTQSADATAKLTEIKIFPAGTTLAKGTDLQLGATGIFSDGKQQDLSTSVSWKATPSTVLNINAEGKVTGVDIGVAFVSAAYQGLTGSASLTVGPAVLTGITVSPQASSLPLGETEPMTATGTFSDGTTQDSTQLVTWQANPHGVATISTQGTLTSLGQGVAQVSAAYQSQNGTATVTVIAPALLSLAVTLPQPSLPLGEAELATAIGTFSDGTTQIMTNLVTWQTNPSTIATITPGGKLMGISQGSAQVSASYLRLGATASVTVGSAALIAVTVTLPKSFEPLGQAVSATANGVFSDGNTKDLSQSVAWSVSPAIATVSSTGVVVGTSVGNATLSAGVGLVIGTANLTITPNASIVALNITPLPSILLGVSLQLQVTATFTDGSTEDVTRAAAWSSQQPQIVSVSSGGVATGEQLGSATVVAESMGLTASVVIKVVPLMTVSYFNLANAVSSGSDGTVRLVNPGTTPGDMCAMVYVFDRNQELNECCGCKISDSGLLTLSLVKDLTANTLTGKKPVAGSVEVVPSDPDLNGQCNAGSPAPNRMIHAWETNIQDSSGSFPTTEIRFANGQLSDTEAQVLGTLCSMIQQMGSGAGICSCGTGN
jgi:hypothetical protein